MGDLNVDLENARLLKRNGSWMYCTSCNKTVGYLCYTTYLDFSFAFTCNCGMQGKIHLWYGNKAKAGAVTADLTMVKNRLCCPNDNSPLFTIVDKNVSAVKYSVVCKKCNTLFSNFHQISHPH
jgi:hypothetical protein